MRNQKKEELHDFCNSNKRGITKGQSFQASSNCLDTNILFVKADTFASAMITSGSYSSPNAALIDSAILDACFSLQNLKSSGSRPYLSSSGEGVGVPGGWDEGGTSDGSPSRQRVTMCMRYHRTDWKSSDAGGST